MGSGGPAMGLVITDSFTLMLVLEQDLYPGAPGTINIDGENFPFKSKITVRCLHKQLQMFVPPTINSDSAGALSAQKSATAGSPLLNA